MYLTCMIIHCSIQKIKRRTGIRTKNLCRIMTAFGIVSQGIGNGVRKFILRKFCISPCLFGKTMVS